MTRPITPADLWAMQRVGQPEHIPGTTSVVVPVVDYHDDDNKARGVLHIVRRDGTTSPLTDRSLNASAPAPSPDGATIAFLAIDEPGGNKQVWRIGTDGSALQRVTDLPKGVNGLSWLPSGDGFVAAVPLYRGNLTVEATRAVKEDRTDTKVPVVTEDRLYRFWNRWLSGETIDHLFRIDLPSGDLVDLTPEVESLISFDEVGSQFAVTPDGTVVIFTLDVGEPAWHVPKFLLHRVPVAGGQVDQLPTSEAVRHSRPRISPDGATVVYGAQFEHGYYADHVQMIGHHLPTGVEQRITEGWDRSAGGWEFIDNESLVLHAEDEGHVRLFTVAVDGDRPRPITTAGSSHGPRVGKDCFWHRSESMHRPAEVAITTGGHTTVVSSFNDEILAPLDLRPANEIRFEGSKGVPIQAFVIEPPAFSVDQAWPLLQNVHGGPHNGVTDSWHWRWNPQVMAADGRVVVSVNFHGSSSFGDAFTRSIRGAWGDMPYQDIEAATDHLIDQGFIDEDRVAIAGGSYGGYLVTWITSQTDRYQASICHAGVTDLLGQWASDLTEGREKAVGGLPWDDMDAIQRWSPMAHTHDIVTPTLVMHGELDYRVVVTQGLELYGVLKHKGVPSRLVYFPDEGHWIEKQPNAMLWWDEFLTWLERWGV